MESTFSYRFRKTSWGICIDMTAEFIACDIALLDPNIKKLLPVSDRLWLHLYSGFPSLTEEEKQMLVLGARIVLDSLSNPFPETPGVIKILELGFPLTEFQPEGLACVMAAWIAREWAVAMPEIPIRYDKPKNVYFFKFPRLPEIGTHVLHGKMTSD